MSESLKYSKILENCLNKGNKNLLRIVCPFFKYEKSSIFKLFIDDDSKLRIKLNCHNHILLVETYFHYFSKNISIQKKNSCDYHNPNFKSIAYCLDCSVDICKNCAEQNHIDHRIQNYYLNTKEEIELIKKESDNISTQIKNIEEKIEALDYFNQKQVQSVKNILLFLFIKKIVYVEYLQELALDNFSYSCLENLNYIKKNSKELIFENIDLNTYFIEKIFNIQKKFMNDYFSEKDNIIDDNSIIEEEKINSKKYKGDFITGNDSYFITVSQKINIYSFGSLRLLNNIEENETIKYILFHPDYYNIFLTSSYKKIKIWEINKSNYTNKQIINIKDDFEIQDIQFIPKDSNNILIIDNNYIIMYDLTSLKYKKLLELKSPIYTSIFSHDGKIFGFLEDNNLIFYKYNDYTLNKISFYKEDYSRFFLRKKDYCSNYNLIIVKSDYIKYYNDILLDKYEKIKISKKINNAHFDDKYDFLYLFSNVLTIIKIEDWSRILEINFIDDIFPLNSSGSDTKLIKGFIHIDKNICKDLYKYTFYCSNLSNQEDHIKLESKEKKYSLNKLQLDQFSSQEFSYNNNIINNNEIIKKKYLNIEEIEKYLIDNFNLPFSAKKETAKKLLRDFDEKVSLYEQYIQIIKMLINDNVNKKILEKYLRFLDKNYEKLKENENIESDEQETKYYSVCFTPKELKDKFKYPKEKDEKLVFMELLKEISDAEITEKNVNSFLSKYEKIKQNIITFNQPIDFNNKELYFYISKVIICMGLIKEKKNKYEYIKNIQYAIKIVLENKLFDDERILNDENKYNKLLIIILRAQPYEFIQYNLNLLLEKNYSDKEKKELISNLDNSMLVKAKSVPGLLADISKIEVNKIDIKYNFDNYLLHLQNDGLFEEYELYNEKELIKFYESKLDFKKIKNFMKNILLSRCIKDAFSLLYGDPYKYPFKTFKDASDYVNNFIEFIPIKDKSAKGATNKFNLKTKIFLKKCRMISQNEIDEKIFYKCLYTASLIKVFLHELNHDFYNFYYYHSNGSVSLTTPRKKNIKEREGGKYFEGILFNQILKKMNLKQAIYILNENNYTKSYFDFNKGFQSLKDSDLIIQGEFSELNQEISKLFKPNQNLSEYIIQTDDDEDDDPEMEDISINVDIEDDVIGSYI